jgi:hypothetical protein
MNQLSINYPQDIKHGIGPQITQSNSSAISLQEINSRYGSLFAGIRLFEVGAEDLTENYCLLSYDCGTLNNYLVSNYFTEGLIEPFISFAKQTGKSAFVGDQLWLPTSENEQNYLNSVTRFRATITSLAQKYPGIIYAAYDNNEVYGAVHRWGLHRIRDWESYLKIPNTKGIALSNQSWMCDRKAGFTDLNCPSEYLAIWSGDAFINKGASIVQFEPFWYFFEWPRATMANSIQPVNLKNSNLGNPTRNLCSIAKSLSVNLSTCPN